MPAESLVLQFDFSSTPSKKEAHWNRDKNLRDVLVHLYEWHQLLINWINSNRAGDKSSFFPKPYSWKTIANLNKFYWTRHQDTSLSSAKELLKISHNEVMSLINSFSNDELFLRKHFDWTGTTSLGNYCISATSSHYDWAFKKLKAHMKMVLKK